jgi:hypothetical protein
MPKSEPSSKNAAVKELCGPGGLLAISYEPPCLLRVGLAFSRHSRNEGLQKRGGVDGATED